MISGLKVMRGCAGWAVEIPVAGEILTCIIHDGSSRCTRCIGKSNGYPAVAKRDGRVEPRGSEAYLKQYVEPTEWRARPLAGRETACQLVAAANPRLQQKRS